MKAIKISRIRQRNKVSSQLAQISIALGMLLLFAASAIGQISWKKYSNYVLGTGSSWDSARAYGPSVILDGGTYKMWYTGHDGSHERIGYAYSSDGVTWTKYTKIGWLNGAGSSAMPHDYLFLDKQVEAGKTYFYYIEDVDIAGERNKSDIIQITVTPRPQAVIPAKFALLQNYPNPFNPETWVPYQLAKDAHVAIIIYNAKGQVVRILNLGAKQAGEYVIRSKAAKWDGRNDLGEKVASGVYFYTLKAGEFSATRKMLIVK